VGDYLAGPWARSAEAFIFLHNSASAPDREALAWDLEHDADVRGYRFLSHAQAYEELRTLFDDEPDIVASVTTETVPESFVVTLRDVAGAATLRAHYATRAGVDQITTYNDNLSVFVASTDHAVITAGPNELRRWREVLDEIRANAPGEVRSPTELVVDAHVEGLRGRFDDWHQFPSPLAPTSVFADSARLAAAGREVVRYSSDRCQVTPDPFLGLGEASHRLRRGRLTTGIVLGGARDGRLLRSAQISSNSNR
jgi:hypothetical protein